MQRRNHRTVTAVATATAIAATAVLGTAATGTAAPREEHCVVRVVGRAADGELLTTAPECASTQALALQRSGAAAAAEWVIGQHFDGQNLSGSSVSVVGDSCIGGWLNLPGSWINRISSTSNGCPTIRHYDGYNLVTPAASTFAPGGNLPSSLNNKTNSIQYF